MPTNLPPDYFEAEQRYRSASTPEEKVACLEDMLTRIPKHKGTDKLRGDLRKKLSKLKSSLQTRKTTSRQESVFHIDREGAGQIVVVGPANVGKSMLVSTLTNAKPEVADYPFTTRKPTPGMMRYENVQFQLIDTPPTNREFIEPELIELIRRADLLLIVVDIRADPLAQLNSVADLLMEYRIIPEHLLQQEEEVERGVSTKLVLVLANKNDDEETDENFEIFKTLLEQDWPLLSISSKTGRNLDVLKRLIFEQMEIIRVYSKAPGREPDMQSPFILDRGCTVEEFAGKVHQDFYKNMKSARLWGSAEHDGIMVGRDYILHDGDIVELKI
jgi:small GTP-binding protein